MIVSAVKLIDTLCRIYKQYHKVIARYTDVIKNKTMTTVLQKEPMLSTLHIDIVY